MCCIKARAGAGGGLRVVLTLEAAIELSVILGMCETLKIVSGRWLVLDLNDVPDAV